MAVTNEALLKQLQASEKLSAERDGALDAKVDDFIGEQRKCNEREGRRLRVLETEQARQDERLTSVRNVFAGIHLAFTAVIAWLGTR